MSKSPIPRTSLSGVSRQTENPNAVIEITVAGGDYTGGISRPSPQARVKKGFKGSRASSARRKSLTG